MKFFGLLIVALGIVLLVGQAFRLAKPKDAPVNNVTLAQQEQDNNAWVVGALCVGAGAGLFAWSFLRDPTASQRGTDSSTPGR
ncbi:MAG TPA: hypothetical protein VIM58_07035 [Candidatus Methylacidiphilales bacterium]